MGCQKFEKWLSDRLDGELPEKKWKALSRHLEKCASCQAYSRDIERIQSESPLMDRPELSASYWEGFTLRLKERASSFRTPKENLPFLLKWKWVWAAPLLTLFVVLGLIYFLNQERTAEEVYVFSLEKAMTRVYQEIGEDAELVEIFNSVILASIGETLGEAQLEERSEFYKDSLFFQDLSEEEMKYLESELKKNN